jgi:hypothetical protein
MSIKIRHLLHDNDILDARVEDVLMRFQFDRNDKFLDSSCFARVTARYMIILNYFLTVNSLDLMNMEIKCFSKAIINDRSSSGRTTSCRLVKTLAALLGQENDREGRTILRLDDFFAQRLTNRITKVLLAEKVISFLNSNMIRMRLIFLRRPGFRKIFSAPQTISSFFLRFRRLSRNGRLSDCR